MVEDIVELRAELQAAAFALKDSGEVLEQGGIGVVEARLPCVVAGGVAEGS